MPRNKKEAFVPVRIKRSDGIIQTIYIRGQKRAKAHPLRVNKKGNYVNTGPFHRAVFLPRKRPPRPSNVKSAPSVAPARPGDEAAPRAPTPASTALKTTRKGARYTTWFKALGTLGSLAQMRGGDSPDLLGEDAEDFNAPAAFYSNQGGLLGQVKFPGILSLAELIDRLNLKLQFSGEETGEFDFRREYPRWEYRYQVVETLGPSDRIIDEQSDRSR